MIVFYLLSLRAVTRAVNNLVAPDQNTSDAVDIRQELDLRIGTSLYSFFFDSFE
jgi:DNA topoisomerase III